MSQARKPMEPLTAAEEQVRSSVVAALKPEDDGKFVAIDLTTGEIEIDPDDYTALITLRTRCPAGKFWLELAGQPTAQVIRAAS